jgi:hypothetical protein
MKERIKRVSEREVIKQFKLEIKWSSNGDDFNVNNHAIIDFTVIVQ